MGGGGGKERESEKRRDRESCLLYFACEKRLLYTWVKKKGHWLWIGHLDFINCAPNFPFFARFQHLPLLFIPNNFNVLVPHIAVGHTIVYILPETEFIVSDLMWQETENCIGRLLLNLITHQIQLQSINHSIRQHKFWISHYEKGCCSCFFSINNFPPFIYYAEPEPVKLC